MRIGLSERYTLSAPTLARALARTPATSRVLSEPAHALPHHPPPSSHRISHPAPPTCPPYPAFRHPVLLRGVCVCVRARARRTPGSRTCASSSRRWTRPPRRKRRSRQPRLVPALRRLRRRPRPKQRGRPPALARAKTSTRRTSSGMESGREREGRLCRWWCGVRVLKRRGRRGTVHRHTRPVGAPQGGGV